MSALPERTFTPEEYLTLEDAAGYKSEYVHGEIYAMAGTGFEHGEVAGNLHTALNYRFRGRPCKAYYADIRVRAAHGDMYTYPDVTALSGEPKAYYKDDKGLPNLVNPQVIAEVLSSSTEAHDRGEKFLGYQQIETVTDYLLISAEQMRLEHYSRQPSGGWSYRVLDQPADLLRLASVDCEIPLAEIYDKVTFPAR